MTEALDQFTQSLHEDFQARADEFFIPSDHEDQEDTPDTGILTGWMLVCAWQGTDGEKWLTYHRQPGAASWETRGLLTEALTDL